MLEGDAPVQLVRPGAVLERRHACRCARGGPTASRSRWRAPRADAAPRAGRRRRRRPRAPPGGASAPHSERPGGDRDALPEEVGEDELGSRPSGEPGPGHEGHAGQDHEPHRDARRAGHGTAPRGRRALPRRRSRPGGRTSRRRPGRGVRGGGAWPEHTVRRRECPRVASGRCRRAGRYGGRMGRDVPARSLQRSRRMRRSRMVALTGAVALATTASRCRGGERRTATGGPDT